eukprot:1142275-Pelagomonas_calceolata.AAC.4
MEAHPGQGQRPLALHGFFKRPHTEGDGPLLSVKQIRLTQVCKQGCSRSRDGAQGRGCKSQAPAVRPVGRPRMDPVTLPAPAL